MGWIDYLIATGLTLSLTIGATLGGLVLAILVCWLGKVAPKSLFLTLGLSSLIRGTPLLLQLFFIYYALTPLLPALPVLHWLQAPFVVALLTLALNCGAYAFHALWGAIQTIPETQSQAASCLGLTRTQIFVHITLPQALWYFWPIFRNEAIFMLKGTALVGSITLMDITGIGKVWLNQSYQPLLTFALIFSSYWLLATLLQWLMKQIDNHWLDKKQINLAS